jgi:hypothetical protein
MISILRDCSTFGTLVTELFVGIQTSCASCLSVSRDLHLFLDPYQQVEIAG